MLVLAPVLVDGCPVVVDVTEPVLVLENNSRCVRIASLSAEEVDIMGSLLTILRRLEHVDKIQIVEDLLI